MNGCERINAALNGEKPDKVPVMLHNFMMAAREHGVSMEQYRNDPKIIADCFVAAVEKYGYDGIVVDIDTVTLAGAMGAAIDFPPDDPARIVSGNIEQPGYISHLKPFEIDNYRYINIWLEAVSILKDYFSNEIYIRGNCDQAPFSLAGLLRGMQNWMIDLVTGNEQEISQLLEYCTEAVSRFVNLMIKTGCDMVSNGDSLAGPEMIPPEFYIKYALPYESKIVKAVHDADMKYALHICGNTDVILEHMLLTGADAFELDYKTDTDKIYRTFHNKAAFIGNIDPSSVLALGTRHEVQKKTLELLSFYKNSDRFILNAGCAIPPDTPSENLRMMIRTARDFR